MLIFTGQTSITYTLFFVFLQDKGLRELASSALSVLVKYDPEYSANFILEKVIPRTLSSDLCMRHGATLAAGELVLALHKCGYVFSTGDFQSVVPTNMPEFVIM